MSPRKGFDADGGAFTPSCCAALCRLVWCGVLGLGRVGAALYGDLSSKSGPCVGCSTWALSLGRVFRRPAVGDLPLLRRTWPQLRVQAALVSPSEVHPVSNRYDRNCMKCTIALSLRDMHRILP